MKNLLLIYTLLVLLSVPALHTNSCLPDERGEWPGVGRKCFSYLRFNQICS